jgi:hypothetical protein
MTKVALYQHIGTEQQRLKKKLRILQKLRLDVSLDSRRGGKLHSYCNPSGRRVLLHIKKNSFFFRSTIVVLKK